MLNSTKAWQEELQQVVYNQEMKPEYRVLFQHRLEQLIMDIRKKDEDELIGMLEEFETYAYIPEFKQLIQDYYEN